MRLKAIKFGPFPHELVNDTLGTELDPGGVHCSVRALLHIQKDHAAEYSMIQANLERIIMDPTFIGQSPRHARNIEFIKRILVQEQGDDGVVLRRYVALAAVGLEPDEHGDYRVRSGYLVKEDDVTLWRSKGNLKIPHRKTQKEVAPG